MNLSPKGLDSIVILSPTRVAYFDLTGSGAETIAHVRENGRLTMMFCAFEGLPETVRFYGQGRVLLPNEAEFAELAPRFKVAEAVRSIIVLDVDRTSTACGCGVPMMDYVKDRPSSPTRRRRRSMTKSAPTKSRRTPSLSMACQRWTRAPTEPGTDQLRAGGTELVLPPWIRDL